MNKKQQIEEMAVLGCVRNPQAKTAKECGKCDFRQGMCNAYRHAESLYNAGYRKADVAEIERLKADNQVLIEALQYMAGMYGFKLSMSKLDNEIEYSCNHYVTDRETWIALKKAENIIDWWE